MYNPLSRRPNGHLNGNGHSLPRYSSAVQEKLNLQNQYWLTPVIVAVPYFPSFIVRLWVPNPRKLHQMSASRFGGRKRGAAVLCFALVVMVFTTFALAKRYGTEEKTWPAPFTGDPPTLVFKREDLQRIWQWEIASGHYPSRRSLPEQLELRRIPDNPALPPRRTVPPSKFRAPSAIATTTRGVGPRRVYLDLQSQPPNVAYPPRPIPGSIADMDIVMEHCDFSQKKYVRDCLEVLRIGAGLDNGRRIRRGDIDDWKYIYVERANETSIEETASEPVDMFPPAVLEDPATALADPDHSLTKKRGVDWETPPVALPPVPEYKTYASLPHPCDPDNPRIFHMFWTGPFTDKPYLALLSFLYTQNTGLHTHEYPEETAACRPQFWLWLNPGPAASELATTATKDMFDNLKSSPWAAPFLHPRFKDVIQFKLWNTTEQLDGVPELRDHWRSSETLFNSGGHVINVPSKNDKARSEGSNTNTTSEDDMLSRTGSKSSSSYDRLSVILSDMARFILCHRFGGIYLDADTLFLRDWEELWGWKGSFAYRWSRMEKYNTAVLRLNKNSALGTFLFKTALKNDFDFHPMTMSRYLKEAYMEGLLLRLPDALFDSAWLTTEYYQRERPPQPFFTSFLDFFETPSVGSAAPEALGFDGFFRGAFSYHFHNFWWQPFDASRNFPDLGPRFIQTERKARAEAANVPPEEYDSWQVPADKLAKDQRDLDWATVMKRTFEAYIRGELPNMYGEWLQW